MILITFIFLSFTSIIYVFTSENKKKTLFISVGIVATYTVFALYIYGYLPWDFQQFEPVTGSYVLVLIMLIIILIIYVLVSKKEKRAWLVSFIIITVYHLYVTCCCGPNPFDVYIMKRMAKPIKEYIIKHGIPKSLENIPNLPYKLNGCQREKYYESETGKRVSKDEAYKYVQITDCKTTRDISVHFRIAKYLKGDEYIEANSTYVSIDFKSPNRTYYEIGLNKKSNKTYFYVDTVRVYRYPNPYNMICSSMKQ